MRMVLADPFFWSRCHFLSSGFPRDPVLQFSLKYAVASQRVIIYNLIRGLMEYSYVKPQVFRIAVFLFLPLEVSISMRGVE
jgi:hypothetical protein